MTDAIRFDGQVVLVTGAGRGELTPDQIAPGVLFLASDACQQSGIVLTAAAGRFSVRTSTSSAGVDFGREPAQPEDFRDRWHGIS